MDILRREKGLSEALSTDRILNNEDIYGKAMQEICTKSYDQTPVQVW